MVVMRERQREREAMLIPIVGIIYGQPDVDACRTKERIIHKGNGSNMNKCYPNQYQAHTKIKGIFHTSLGGYRQKLIDMVHVTTHYLRYFVGSHGLI